MSLQPNEVKTEHIATGAVTTPKIADEAVTTDKLKDGAVKTEKIATGAITGSKIGEAQIYGSKLRDGAVRSEKIAAGAVTTAKIGEAQVTGSRLQDNAVTTEKLSNNAVTRDKIVNGAVTLAKLAFVPPTIIRPILPPVSTGEIATGAITQTKLADGSVSPAKVEAIDTPADGEVPSYNQAQGKFEWKPQPTPPPAINTMFVPRQTPAPNADFTNFPTLDNWVVDGLDLSSIVPAGATAVALSVQAESYAGNRVAFGLRQNADNPWMRINLFTGPDAAPNTNFAILKLDSDRMLDYFRTTGMDEIYVTVHGWFI